MVGIGVVDAVGGCGVGGGSVAVVFGGSVGCHHCRCDGLGDSTARGNGKIVVVTNCFVDFYQ